MSGDLLLTRLGWAGKLLIIRFLYVALPQTRVMLLTTTSERQGRVIDHDQSASMEKKKKEGYF